jgi:hypothetical protein
MSSPAEQRMIGNLQQINAAVGSMSGLRTAQVVADTSTASQSIAHSPTTAYRVLVINISKLAGRTESATEDPKKAPTAPKKAVVNVLVQMPLPIGAAYKIAELAIAKEGQTMIELPFCPSAFTVDVRLEEGTESEYSICGI